MHKIIAIFQLLSSKITLLTSENINLTATSLQTFKLSYFGFCNPDHLWTKSMWFSTFGTASGSEMKAFRWPFGCTKCVTFCYFCVPCFSTCATFRTMKYAQTSALGRDRSEELRIQWTAIGMYFGMFCGISYHDCIDGILGEVFSRFTRSTDRLIELVATTIVYRLNEIILAK